MVYSAMLFGAVHAIQSESNRIAAAAQFSYAKPLLFYTLLWTWWPRHAFAVTQIDAHIDDVSNNAATATDHQNAAHLHRAPAPAPTLSPQHFAILDLRTKINRQLKSMYENELLVPTIQNLYDSIDPVPLSASQNDTKILGQMAAKMEAKLTKAILTVEEASAKIMDIVASAESTEAKPQTTRNHYERILLETIVLPCSPEARSFEQDAAIEARSTHDLDDNKSIEILNYLSHAAGHLHETSDKNFTTNSRILDEIKTIQMSAASETNSISFRDFFFLAKDNYASVSNCRRYFPNEEYRRLLISHLTSKRIILILDNGASPSNEEHDVSLSLGESNNGPQSK